jgi:hypothetical protein
MMDAALFISCGGSDHQIAPSKKTSQHIHTKRGQLRWFWMAISLRKAKTLKFETEFGINTFIRFGPIKGILWIKWKDLVGKSSLAE